MFGGVDHIPDNVKDAMKMQDYGKGKPLTARRILAVKAAIDAVKLGTFQSADAGGIALNMGFVKSEFPKLARTAHFYAQATGLSELEALKAVAEPNSKPNRLMQYGGRFLDNAENFANGLRLLDSFKDWFTAVRETKNADGNSFANAQSFTDLNFYSHHATHDTSAGFERFVFEELAVNGAHDLSGTDPEKLFGMKDNAAMRFFGTNRQAHFTGVMASVPPEKRGAIFAVFDKLSKPLPETKEDAKAFYAMPLVERGVRDSSLVICRILRHLPEIESLMAKGELTEANIVKTLCPDMPSHDWTIGGLNEFTHDVDDVAKTKMRDLGLDEDNVEDLGQNIRLVMEETCCTVDEAVEAVMTGKRVAPPKYMTNATYDIYKLDGTTKAARNSSSRTRILSPLASPSPTAPRSRPTRASTRATSLRSSTSSNRSRAGCTLASRRRSCSPSRKRASARSRAVLRHTASPLPNTPPSISRSPGTTRRETSRFATPAPRSCRSPSSGPPRSMSTAPLAPPRCISCQRSPAALKRPSSRIRR